MELLLSLLESVSLKNISREQRGRVLGQFLDSKISNPLIRLSTIKSFIELDRLDQIDSAELILDSDLQRMMVKLLIETLSLGSDNDFLMDNILQKIKDPSILFVYLSRINSLPEEDKSLMIRSFRDMIVCMSKGKEVEWGADSSHFKMISQLGAQQDVITKWVALKRRLLVSLIKKSESKSQNELFLDFLSALKINGHIKNLESRFPSLYSFLNGNSLQGSLDEVEAKIRGYSAHKQHISKDLKIENQMLLACRDPDYRGFSTLKKLISAGEDLRVFKSDFEAFLETFGQKPKEEKYFLEVSEGFRDLFYLGRETGGCQNIDNPAFYNKCLLGYADGKNKIFAIKNKDGRMIARCIARLLWDERIHSPVIFLEKVYTLNPTEKYAPIFVDFVKKISEELKIPFYASVDFDKTQSSQEVMVKSFGCIAPFEYCDSVDKNSEIDGITRGNYSIREAILVS